MNEKPSSITKEQEHLLALYTTLKENITARFQYADFLGLCYRSIEDNSFPNLKPEAEMPRDNLLRMIHLALASEVFKASDVLAAIGLSAGKLTVPAYRQLMRTSNTEADNFFESFTTGTPHNVVRALFPFPNPADLPVSKEERQAVEAVTETYCFLALRGLLEIKRWRAFLRPFRHKFSHTYAVVTSGNPLHGVPAGFKYAIPALKVPSSLAVKSPDAIERILIAGETANRKLVGMLPVIMELELMLGFARVNEILQGRPVLPTKPMFRGPVGNMPAIYEATFHRLGYKVASLSIQTSYQLKGRIIQDALDFYDSVSKFEMSAKQA